MNTILQGQIKGADKELSNLSNRQKALHNVGGRPNKNLLINAYFVGGGSQQGNGQFPINGKGKTSYTSGNPTIDRWNVSGNGEQSLSINTDGITLTSTAQYGCYMDQHLVQHVIDSCKGKVVTYSVLSTGQNTAALSINLYVDDEWTDYMNIQDGLASKQFTIPSTANSFFFSFGASAAGSCKLTAAKLELGSTQTLAYQDESGAWQLFETPDFATEYIRTVSYNYNGDYIGLALGMGLRVNKNLLDNWYFVGGGSQQGGGQFPINQRGQTSYTGDRSKKIDRFISDATMSLQPDCIRLINSANQNALWWIQQIFEADRFEVGTTLTVSVLVKVQSTVPFDVLLQATATTNAWDGGVRIPKTGKYELVSYTTTLQAALSYVAGFGLVTHSGADTGNSDYIDVKAMKVEFGTVQTLAYQDEDGNWQLFETPDFQEELAKCQRYLRTYDLVWATAPSTASEYLQTQVVYELMAGVPTITIGSIANFGGTEQPDLNVVSTQKSENAWWIVRLNQSISANIMLQLKNVFLEAPV